MVSRGRAAQVAVSVVPHGATVAAGVRGVLMTLTAADGVTAVGGKVRVRLGYPGFAGEYGGAWASRLRLVELAAAVRADDAGRGRLPGPAPPRHRQRRR